MSHELVPPPSSGNSEILRSLLETMSQEERQIVITNFMTQANKLYLDAVKDGNQEEIQKALTIRKKVAELASVYAPKSGAGSRRRNKKSNYKKRSNTYRKNHRRKYK
jgi:hypothetical protein